VNIIRDCQSLASEGRYEAILKIELALQGVLLPLDIISLIHRPVRNERSNIIKVVASVFVVTELLLSHEVLPLRVQLARKCSNDH